MDSRRRTKVVVDDAGLFTSSNTVFQSLLLNVLFIVVAHIEKHLVSSQYGVHALLAKVMIGPSAVCLLWGFASGRLARVSSLKWSLVVFTSFCLYLKYVTLLQVLSTLSPLRVLLFIQYSPMLADSILKPSSKHRALLALSSLLIPFLFDILNARSDVWTTWTAYTIIAVQVMSSGLYEHARASMNIVVEDVIATALSIIGATLFTLLGCAPEIVLEHPLTTASSIPYHMSAGILLMVVLSHHPLLSSHANMLSSGNFVVSYILTIVSASIIGYVGFGESPTAVDIVTAICLFCGVQRSPATSGESPFTNVIRIARSYLNSILANSESRKIFYFLMLNMCYMLVQMLYGIWTNSLGLISDAIHMAFDCMAIGVGLVASVMARWPPNERYTYGYSRIETLSGFSNGIFLILISVFIVFEAIQRILSPPEMNTSQLLLVSSGGLAVNLFGMFAMGGHHHHGHSHSHSHSHSHNDMNTSQDDHHMSHSHEHSHSSSSHLPRLNTSLIAELDEHNGASVPLTPSYHFEHDEHLEHYHGQHLPEQSQEGHSHNMRGVFLHVMADTLGSVGVIISTLLIQFYGWTGFDPIASLFIAVLIAASVVPLIVDTGKVLLLDASDQVLSVHQSTTELKRIQGIKLQLLQFWPKNDSSIVGSIHIEVKNTSSHRLYQILNQTDHILRDTLMGLDDLTIQIAD